MRRLFKDKISRNLTVEDERFFALSDFTGMNMLVPKSGARKSTVGGLAKKHTKKVGLKKNYYMLIL